MIELKLHIRTLPDGRVVLELGLGFRIVFGFLATILALGVAGSGSLGLIPVGALVVLAIGALYQEQWTIDPEARTLTSRHGLMVLSRRRTWSFDDIDRVEYTHYRAGSVPGAAPGTPPGAEDPSEEAMSAFGRMGRTLKRHFLRYSIVTTGGRRVRVEIRRVRDWAADVRLPQTMAQKMGVPLEETPL